MSTPSPDFDETRYERPNKDWICGRACDGCPCRIGPSPQGECRATTECKPQLVRREGETKGTWQCTRPKDWGGACATGPLPDGTCCLSIPKCRPARSLRNKRGLLTRAVLAASVGVLMILIGGPWRESFISPALLSVHHSGVEFEKMSAARVAGGRQGCVACHAEMKQGFPGWTAAALKASHASLAWSEISGTHPKDFSRMDASCLACHPTQSFHAANVATEQSCSRCHLEHRGGGPMATVSGQRCTDCHGVAAEMLAAAEKGRTQPGAFFARPVQPGLLLFRDLRPPEGYTQPVTGFATDHPEFRVMRAGAVKDENTLAFNHALHLSSRVPALHGGALECASCHRPDTSGAFMQRVSFEQSCRACHSLQFDEHSPGMELPHGDATYVRAYLRSLPAQYADYATRKLHLGANELAPYVEAQMQRLRTRTRTGELLEEQVFFSDMKQGPAAAIAGLEGPARAKFAGCATCHEITPRANSAPYVTPPVMPDHWLSQARFNHAKHLTVACVSCHTGAAKSELTADILLPTQQSCVRCHGPKGGVSDSCTECHSYHNAPPPGWSRYFPQ